MSSSTSFNTGIIREINPPEVDAQSTHATAWANSTQIRMPLLNTFHSGGGPHAEDNLASYIEKEDLKDMTLCVYLTKSPCTSTKRSVNGLDLPATGKGCAEMLAKLAVQRNLKFQFLVRNYYQPAISNSDKASIEAVKCLHATGNFAFCVDKEPKSKVGKALEQKFADTIDTSSDENGFVCLTPADNDFSDDL